MFIALTKKQWLVDINIVYRIRMIYIFVYIYICIYIQKQIQIYMVRFETKSVLCVLSWGELAVTACVCTQECTMGLGCVEQGKARP